MPVIFSNAAGFWALLGIPVILLIHFLQRESRRLPVSTLFLLEMVDRQSIQGRKLDRLRNSVPLWLQLLAVLLLTWLLVQPRWTSERSVQRIVLVLDSSASMSAFSEETISTLQAEIPPLSAVVGTTEYRAMESQLRGATLYSGTEFPELVRSLENWEPSESAHSPEAALRVGRSLAGSEGTLIYVTDHPLDELPFAANQISVGEPLENVGIAGHRIDNTAETATWQVSVRNYATTPQTREWVLTANGQRTEARTIALGPGETRTLQGKFPAASSQVSILLKSDEFPKDDERFLLIPEPKQITFSRTGAANLESVVADIAASLPNAPQSEAGTEPDFVFASYDPLQPNSLPPVSITFLNQQRVPREFFGGPIVNANHPLIDELDWQGLIAKKTASIPVGDDDFPLLWQGDRPLIILRDKGDTRQLIFNFDVVNSNAGRLPGFIILIHRFVDELRRDLITLEKTHFELRQPLDLAFQVTEDAPDLTVETQTGSGTISLPRARSMRAPAIPGFFRVAQGNVPLLVGGSNFADTREADFSKAETYSDVANLPGQIAEEKTVTDPWWQLWVLLLVVLLLLVWLWTGKSEKPSENSAIAQTP